MSLKRLSPAVLLAFSTVFCDMVHAEPEVPSDYWRNQRNGAINVLYCYLRVNSSACTYSSLLQDQATLPTRQTATSLAQLASMQGFALSPYSLSMKQLELCAFPVIVHVDGDGPEVGAFFLLLSVTDKAVIYINGPSASVQSMSREDFRRVWSGIALLQSTNRQKAVIFSGLGFGFGLTLPLLAFKTRLKASLSK